MHDYEMMVIIRPELDGETLQATLNRIEELIARHQGSLQNTIMWGRRKLAYPLSSARQASYRAREGVYVIFEMAMPASETNTLSRDLRLLEDVLRFLIIVREHGAGPANEQMLAATEPAVFQNEAIDETDETDEIDEIDETEAVEDENLDDTEFTDTEASEYSEPTA